MAENLYGGSSVQVFAEPGLANLEHAHEDAIGFLDYVSRFNALNFRMKDDDVAQWRFDPVFDNAQGWRGTDSVKVYYHGGHGDIAGRAPTGADGQCLGDPDLGLLRRDAPRRPEAPVPLPQYVRVRLRDGQRQPVATWNSANRGMQHGLRIRQHLAGLVGVRAELLRVWNTGVSFSQAWQEASQSLTHNQIVSSTACGSTREEAQDRLWNERLFNGARVSWTTGTGGDGRASHPMSTSRSTLASVCRTGRCSSRPQAAP